jgi:hypothetical protein
MISPNASTQDAPGRLAANSKGNEVAEASIGSIAASAANFIV